MHSYTISSSKHAMPAFEANGKAFTQSMRLLWDILVSTAADSEAGEVVCILDAMDECSETDRTELIRLFKYFTVPKKPDQKLSRLKLLVTCRPYWDIERQAKRAIQDFPSISIPTEVASSAICSEIDVVISREVAKLSIEADLDKNAIQTLQQELTKMEQRTYLWLDLVLKLIRASPEYVTSKRLTSVFKSLPKSIEDAYSTMLDRSTDKDRAMKLLHIICAAQRPLSLSDMRTVMAIEQDPYLTKPEDLDLEPLNGFAARIKTLCGLFITIQHGKVYLLHHTAREFLVTHSQPRSQSLHSLSTTMATGSMGPKIQ